MNTNDIAVKMVLDRWFASIKNFEALLNAFSDEQLQREVAPGKNRGIYLLGHLIAVHDDMIRLLGFGDKMYPELQEAFLTKPDKVATEIPSVAALRAMWTSHNDALTKKINGLKPEEWFEGHTAVSAEDFEKEPHRNKLNIMLTRTTHLQYHIGQFIFLK